MTKQGSAIEMARLLEQAKLQLPLQLQAITIQAETTRHYYEELMKQGFTKEEALEIVKSQQS